MDNQDIVLKFNMNSVSFIVEVIQSIIFLPLLAITIILIIIFGLSNDLIANFFFISLSITFFGLTIWQGILIYLATQAKIIFKSDRIFIKRFFKEREVLYSDVKDLKRLSGFGLYYSLSKSTFGLATSFRGYGKGFMILTTQENQNIELPLLFDYAAEKTIITELEKRCPNLADSKNLAELKTHYQNG